MLSKETNYHYMLKKKKLMSLKKKKKVKHFVLDQFNNMYFGECSVFPS